MTTEQQLIEAQRKYIEFLGEELGRIAVTSSVMPHLLSSQERVDEGARRRAEIAALEHELKPLKEHDDAQRGIAEWVRKNVDRIKSGEIKLPYNVVIDEPVRSAWKVSREDEDKFRLEKLL